MIIDNCQSTRENLKTILKGLKHTVVDIVEVGALMKCSDSIKTPDIIITELHTKQQYGQVAAGDLLSEYPTAKILYHTTLGKEEKNIVVEGMNNGISGYIEKPLCIDDLKETLLEILGIKRKSQEIFLQKRSYLKTVVL